MYRDPDYEYVHAELKKVGVTLKLLWNEFKDKCRTENATPMGYTKYCGGYGKHVVANKLTNHFERKPGITTEVDYSGPTMSYVDQNTGEVITVYLFVATLPYSRYSYVEPRFNRKQAWLRCHGRVHRFIMYWRYPGCPVIILIRGVPNKNQVFKINYYYGV